MQLPEDRLRIVSCLISRDEAQPQVGVRRLAQANANVRFVFTVWTPTTLCRCGGGQGEDPTITALRAAAHLDDLFIAIRVEL